MKGRLKAKVFLGSSWQKKKANLVFFPRAEGTKSIIKCSMGLSEKKLLDSPMHLLPCRRHQILFFMQFLARWRAKNCE
jgi:hypothetical protein